MSHATSCGATALIVAAAFAACTEPRPTPHAAPVPPLEARLELSDTLPPVGSTIEIRVRVVGKNQAQVASFAERVAYDTLRLRYVEDIQVADGATRVTNPVVGLIRSAGVRAAGFGDGLLVAYRFKVLDPSAIGSLRLSIDELHEIDHSDASRMLSVAHTAVLGRP